LLSTTTTITTITTTTTIIIMFLDIILITITTTTTTTTITIIILEKQSVCTLSLHSASTLFPLFLLVFHSSALASSPFLLSSSSPLSLCLPSNIFLQ